jgi:hypothetical protein
MIFSDDLTARPRIRSTIKFFAAHVQRLRRRQRKTPEPAAAQHVSCFGPRGASATLAPQTREATDVDLALRLNVLAVCAVFLFVGAVLLGAF